MSEVAIGRAVVPWLERAGWDVYQEVDAGPGKADVVAIKGRLLAVFELKQGPSLDLLGQLMRWQGYAHLVCCATWRTRTEGTFGTLGRRFGFGWLVLPRFNVDGRDPSWRLEPSFSRAKLADLLANKLNQGQKTHAEAGTNRGGSWAPWRDTARELAAEVARHPDGVLLKDAVDAIKHHYGTSAAGRRGCQFLLERNLVPAVKLERREGRLWAVRVVT